MDLDEGFLYGNRASITFCGETPANSHQWLIGYKMSPSNFKYRREIFFQGEKLFWNETMYRGMYACRHFPSDLVSLLSWKLKGGTGLLKHSYTILFKMGNVYNGDFLTMSIILFQSWKEWILNKQHSEFSRGRPKLYILSMHLCCNIHWRHPKTTHMTSMISS